MTNGVPERIYGISEMSQFRIHESMEWFCKDIRYFDIRLIPIINHHLTNLTMSFVSESSLCQSLTMNINESVTKRKFLDVLELSVITTISVLS